ncbi:putative disease resistance protein At3g14460 [Hevea brasiliensis]|uniref:putative disease resistance protein At3g14460 n=1 Tax=Hevea brasiliensis TaxID=3981 RepID=UPI0025DDE27C|nr:putative disease resistance protein At3g14460 [Hevea brasiliensis]
MVVMYPIIGAVGQGTRLESIAERLDNNTSLESIEITYLQNLNSLPENLHMLSNLHHIWICQCPHLISFPQGGLPIIHLKSVTVEDCEKLETLPDNVRNLTSLQTLMIINCASFVSFPQGGLPINLETLEVESCEKLETLPNNMHYLTSLQELTMKNRPGIISFPEEGFPTNLTSLCIIKNVEICTALFNWGLHRLTSLKKLGITGRCPGVVSFPQDEIDMNLPTCLTSLTVSKDSKI